MKMNGSLAELMVKTDPKIYQKYVTIEKGRQVLYLRLQKALYGMMKSALLFYRKLIKELKGMGLRSTHTIHAWQINLWMESR
jgi:hypothetical protein